MMDKKTLNRLIEGMERNEGRSRPDDDSGGTSKDPGMSKRKKVIITCNGYTDPKDGRKKVAPGHKAKETVFAQDAHQMSTCDACQTAYRSAYKIAWASKKAAHGNKPMLG
jgi:hypothetical protein